MEGLKAKVMTEEEKEMTKKEIIEPEASVDSQLAKGKTASAELELPSKVNVLVIGNRPKTKRTPQVAVDKRLIFLDNCKQHFGQLLLKTKNPSQLPNDRFVMEYFQMVSHDEDGQLMRAEFYCHSPGYLADSYFGQVIYAKAAMHFVRTHIEAKYWTSENSLEMPLIKDKLRYEGYNYSYVHNTVVDAVHDQKMRIFKFLLHLHREHVNGR